MIEEDRRIKSQEYTLAFSFGFYLGAGRFRSERREKAKKNTIKGTSASKKR